MALSDFLDELEKRTRDDVNLPSVDRRQFLQANVDRALYHLLKENESSLPPLDDNFHKMFRQVDVTTSGDIDMAMWRLINCSEAFWELFEKHREDKP